MIDAVDDFYRNRNANVARGLHRLSEDATLSYEGVRDKIRSFINAEDCSEIIFTKNSTEAINIIMRGFGEKFIKKGDRIVTSELEHHSNFVPWQVLAKKKKAVFEVARITADGSIDEHDLEKKITGARIVAVSAASNVTGAIPNVRKISKIAHDNGAVCVVDGAQYVPSFPTDVRRMGCDFLVFSGHKMLAPFGVGVLYGRAELLESMDPFLYGSEMIRKVTLKASQWSDLPSRFESGTPDVGSVAGFGAAIDYISKIGFEDIRSHEEGLTRYALEALGRIDGLRVLGPTDPRKRASLVSFTLGDIHPHDVAALLDEDGIAVRSGHHCAMPLHDALGISASTRASFYIYNTKAEIDSLEASLGRAIKVFK